MPDNQVEKLLTQSPVLGYFMALAALSLVSMSVLQAVKNLLPIRYAFQGWFLRRWLRRHARIANHRLGLKAEMDGKKIDRADIVRVLGTIRSWATNKMPLRGEVKRDEIDRLVKRAEAETIFLAADGSAVALFNADGDDFIKLLGAAAQMVVDFPREYGVLLTIIACNMQESDFRILTGLEKRSREIQPEEKHKGEKNRKGHEPVLEAPKPEPPKPEPLLNQAFLEAKNRVRMQVVQAISAYQLRSNWGWGTIMRVSSFGISIGLALAGERLIYGKTDLNLETYGTAMLAAFLAPVARDLVATIEKLRSA